MTFEEFLEEKNITPENTPGSEHALMQEAYGAGYEAGKKYSIAWHKTELYKTIEPTLKNGRRYLVLSKNGDICSVQFWRGKSGGCFETYEDIEAWAEMPEVKL